jgi:hypothetical protein
MAHSPPKVLWAAACSIGALASATGPTFTPMQEDQPYSHAAAASTGSATCPNASKINIACVGDSITFGARKCAWHGLLPRGSLLLQPHCSLPMLDSTLGICVATWRFLALAICAWLLPCQVLHGIGCMSTVTIRRRPQALGPTAQCRSSQQVSH